MTKRLLTATTFAALLAGCSGSGTVRLELTDAPPDTGAMKHVYVTIDKVQLHVADKDADEEGDPDDTSIDKDDKWVEVDLENQEFDLLSLQNDVTAPLGEADVPDGKITQIRLFIDPAGTNQVVLNDDSTCSMQIKEGVEKGIKINHPFKAIDVGGDERGVVLDFDIKESVDDLGGCSYVLKPVIKIKKIK